MKNPYSIRLSTKNECVILSCEGNMSLADLVVVWQKVQSLLAETGWQRILVDVTRLRTFPETEQLFDFAKLLWKSFPKNGRLAMEVRWDQSGPAKFLEMLVRSVGIYLTVFVSEQQAQRWLLED